MRRRSIIVPLLTALALLVGAAPALAASAGATFLIGGLDLPAGAIAGGVGGYGEGEPDRVSVSGDGRYVAFTAQADTLDAAASPDVDNVFRKDLLTGAVVLVSRANGAAGAGVGSGAHRPAISDDGARVAFLTRATLAAGDTDGGREDVYVRDVASGTTTLASVGNGGAQTAAATSDFDLSGDGQHVAFTTSDALDAANDRNGLQDVYLRDLAGATTTLVSINTTGNGAGTAASQDPSVSDDGGWVAFATSSTNVATFTPGSGTQVFVRDIGSRATSLVSAASSGATRGANGASREPDVAGAPARAATASVFVAYTSNAIDIDAADGSTDASVYRRQLSVPASTLVSRADGVARANADSRAHTPSISDDGARVVFSSDAANLGAGADYYGVYLRNVASSRTVLASTDNEYAVEGAISDDGGRVAWINGSGVTADSDPELIGVFARTYAAPATLGAAQYVSRPPGSAPFLAPAFAVGDALSGARTLSADGRYAVFVAYTRRLPGANPPYAQAYRRDTLTGAVELVSRADGPSGAAAQGYVADPTISADGTRVAFVSAGTNLEGGTGTYSLVYVRDLVAGTTRLVSRAEGTGGAVADGSAAHARISADGAHVSFLSRARDLGPDASGRWHVYLRDLAGAHTQLVDRATGAGGAIANGDADEGQPSADGRHVVFGSAATNLDPADADTTHDLYVRDTVAGTTTLVSRAGGLGGAKAARASRDVAISADGSTVAFEATDEALAPEAGGWGGTTQIVARTLASGANALVSRAPGGAPADVDARNPSVSGDGSVIAFNSTATNLLPGVGGGSRYGVFARTTASGALSGPPAFGLVDIDPQGRAVAPSLSDDGQCMAFQARGHNAVTGAAGDFMTAYVYVVSGECPKPLVAISGRRRATPGPTLSKVSISHKRFRVGTKPTARSAASASASAAAVAAAKRKGRRGRRAPVGTAFRFTLNTRANVAIAIERPAQGRLVGRFCRRPTRRLRKHLRCVRYARVGRIARGGVRAGRGSIAFSGRIGRRALKPGAYRARLRATNSAGSSRWVRVTFTVVR